MKAVSNGGLLGSMEDVAVKNHKAGVRALEMLVHVYEGGASRSTWDALNARLRPLRGRGAL